MNVQIHSTPAAMSYALRHGALPTNLVSPALLADLIERGWAQPDEKGLTLTKRGKIESVCLLS